MATIPRFPIWLYVSIGLMVVAAGWLAKFYIDAQEDIKAEALLRPAPEAVLVEELDRTRDTGAGNEVTVRAQLALDLTGNVKTLDDENARTGTFYGLFPVTALDSKRAVEALLLSQDYILDAPYLSQITVGEGPLGPIIEVNGAVGSSAEVWKQIERTLESLGRTLPKETLTIVPFVEGRDVALRPDPNKGNQIFMLFALVGAIYLGYGLLRWYPPQAGVRLQ